MAYTKLNPHQNAGGTVDELLRGASYRFTIPAGSSRNYRLSQVDDYTKLSRGRFPLRPPVHLSLSARASSGSIPGTWGFGLWNDPFGLSIGFGGNPLRIPALPNAAWFFHASEQSYLSFRNDKPANGFLAQTFRSPAFHPALILAGLAFPFSRRKARGLMGKAVGEDGVRLGADVTRWHRYSLDWRATRVAFEVDDAPVGESPVSPNPPLGLVIWIDNQYAAFTPEGKFGLGVLENYEPAWLEIRDLELD